ncbi:MAG: branched-chain amino acid ABC transporter permease, partial [Alphaproteobacteria bacterium]|nr:branched-chain amino acid ABC transporter permease [Alphaproteobacteria bacterium]
MNPALSNPLLFAVMAGLLAAVGFGQSWAVALTILNLCLISAVMALGLNMQWGYAGLFNVGVMGFAAVGGLATVLISKAPVVDAWAAGGWRLGLAALALLATAAVVVAVRRWLGPGPIRSLATAVLVIAGYFVVRIFFDPATEAIEAVNSAKTGYLGGLGLPVLLSWIVGGLLAAGVAWFIGKVALGLRSDYFAIATLGISEIVIAILKNEDWLARGVKNVTGLSRPVPYEVNLQGYLWFADFTAWLGADVIEASSIFVKLCYAALFLI